MSEPRVAIVGGGISGLATAYFLGRQGADSVLIEKSSRLGGLIRTDRWEDCLLEAGADSYLAAKPAVTELARELPALAEQIIGSNDAARRIFVVRDSKLIAMPRGMVMMVPADLSSAIGSPLFSAKTKLGFLTETLSRPRSRPGDFSVGELIADHFGSELLDYAADPLLAGVYGGHSAKLSAPSVLPRFVAYERDYGSLIRAVRRERRVPPASGLFLSFRNGMQSLVDAVRAAAGSRTRVLHAEARSVEYEAGAWRIDCGQETIRAHDLVLACPAYSAARLLENAAPSLASELALIPYSSAILVTLVYDRAALAHPLNGFGFLVPRTERRTIAAATWVSTKFPSRTPPDRAAVRAFIVAENATQLLGAPEQQIIDLVRSDLARFMEIEAAPRFSSVQAWPESMPQYVVGHQQRLINIAAAAAQIRGLHLAGNAYDGVGIPDCVRLAKETAKRIVEAPGPRTSARQSERRGGHDS